MIVRTRDRLVSVGVGVAVGVAACVGVVVGVAVYVKEGMLELMTNTNNNHWSKCKQ